MKSQNKRTTNLESKFDSQEDYREWFKQEIY